MSEVAFTSRGYWKYFWISVGMALMCAILAGMAFWGSANIMKLDVVGEGDIYVRHDWAESADLASAVNSTVGYSYERDWNGTEDPVEVRSQFMVVGATSEGGFRNQYVVKTSGVGYKTVYRATQLTGDFQGDMGLILTTTAAASEDLKPGEEMVSTINLDTTFGNGTIQGRVWTRDGEVNRPATKEELDAVGKFLITSYLELSAPPETYEDWLSFCSTVDRDDISAYPGVYVEPVWLNGTCGTCGGGGCAKCGGGS
jgi:hypothetical protein